VTYNDDTNEDNLITYTNTGRHVNAGASEMGWSYSDDGGTTWTYGGKVQPPQGWAALWGDPAMASSKSSCCVVFMSNLAMPNSKFPLGGVDGAVNFGQESYVGGACIAKSSDSGKHFAIYQCVMNTQEVIDVGDSTLGHFYDGGSMVASSTGEIFAAFNDVATNQIDVYRSPNDNGMFTPTPPPFLGMYVGSHPRLRAAPDGSVYIAAQVEVNNGRHAAVYINRWSNGSWGKAVQATDFADFYYLIGFGTSVDGSAVTLRVGPSFSFDIGASSPDGSDAIRVLSVGQVPNSPLHFIQASVCYADLHQNCAAAHEWDFPPSGTSTNNLDVFYPEVVASTGFGVGLPATWQATWGYHLGQASTVNLNRATLGYFPDGVSGRMPVFPIDILQDTPVCSDLRGYWGDYDSMLLAGRQDSSSVWMRFITDSSQGCPTRWLYLGKTQHVQQANYVF
jgi:hypothetical protein